MSARRKLQSRRLCGVGLGSLISASEWSGQMALDESSSSTQSLRSHDPERIKASSRHDLVLEGVVRVPSLVEFTPEYVTVLTSCFGSIVTS